jgi:hypothetical protein
MGNQAVQGMVAPGESTGEPLEHEVQQHMGSRFGEDLSEVRVHTDTRAAESAKALQAEAYTSGRDIYFASGKYAPKTSEGQRLLAHELAHTVQQGRASLPSQMAVQTHYAVAVSQPNDPLEGEADRASKQFKEGVPVSVTRGALGSTYALQRQITMTPDPNKMGRCKDLLALIKEAAAVLIQRAIDLVNDPLDLQWDNWTAPKILPDGTNVGSVVGHQQQYEGWRNRLRNLIDQWKNDDCNSTGLRIPQDVRDLAYKPTPEPIRRPRPETRPQPWTPPGAEPSPSPIAKRVGAAATGGLIGAGVGAVLGGIVGGVLGASGGTLVAPGVGTVSAGAAGVGAGIEAGAWVGAAVGTAIGGLIGWLTSD